MTVDREPVQSPEEQLAALEAEFDALAKFAEVLAKRDTTDRLVNIYLKLFERKKAENKSYTRENDIIRFTMGGLHPHWSYGLDSALEAVLREDNPDLGVDISSGPKTYWSRTYPTASLHIVNPATGNGLIVQDTDWSPLVSLRIGDGRRDSIQGAIAWSNQAGLETYYGNAQALVSFTQDIASNRRGGFNFQFRAPR